ncbi:MAG: glutamate-5-semialdehyde dehydrogenase, partial [Myxococcota bacterium]|nr:glutamate-5-semialdehyde dehydrogenase [Myxococcota bacterium]
MSDGTTKSVHEICDDAKRASAELAQLSDARRSEVLRLGADALRDNVARILSENAKDLAAGKEAGLKASLIDRLTLDAERIETMAQKMEQVAALADPLAETIASWKAPSGIDIAQVRIPIGVIGVIYESRPNVTVDVAALCLKSGNAAILKGGKEAFYSNGVLAELLSETLSKAQVSPDVVQLIRSTERSATHELLQQSDTVDVIIPRGGLGLIKAVEEHSKIPVVKHYEGVCHVYVDKDANLEMATDIALNAKVQRPGVCNAMENLLVHQDVAKDFLAQIGPRLREAGVELRACETSAKYLEKTQAAAEEDWSTEYLDLILAVKTVDALGEAVTFVNRYGSG